MTKLILLLATLAGAAFAQNPAQCLYSGVWVPCSMIPTVQEAQTVNVKVSGGAGTTITQAFGVATTKGNTILCLGMESAAAIPVITDADGNTFAVVASSATAPGYTIAVANNILGTSTDTITLTTTSGAAAFACHEIKGSVPIGQVWDLSNGQQGTGATITYANTAATIPGEMILTAVGLGAGSVNATPALGGNNTSLVTVDANNTAVTGGAALSIFYAAHTSLSTLANFTQTESLNASQTYSGVIVSIKPPTMVNGPILGMLANNTSPAAANRVASLPGVAQSSYNNGVAATQGRDAALSVGLDGLLWVGQLPAMRPASYTAAARALAASSTTDNACLPGNATNTVLVTEIRVSGIQTTAGISNVEIAKRSSAGSGGTSANITVVPDDSNYAAGVSVPVSYTGTGPTVGTLVGDIDSSYIGMLAAATASSNDIHVSNFRQKPIVLRGTAEKVCVNMGGAITGGTLDIVFKWLETATITP